MITLFLNSRYFENSDLTEDIKFISEKEQKYYLVGYER